MTFESALADFREALKRHREVLNLRLEELNASIKELDGKDRDDPTYAETYQAREEAFEDYNQAYDTWHEETEKPPAGATAEGNETKTNS